MDQSDDRSVSTPAAEFLVEDYKLKVQYLTDQFTRMWNRFQFLLGLETVVAGLYFAPLGATRFYSAPAFALLGIAVSVFWYVVGAEDRFLVSLYRSQVMDAGDQVARSIGLHPYTRVGDVSHPHAHSKKIPLVGLTVHYRNLLEWRIESISTTHLVAVFPLAAVVFWLVLLVLLVLGR